MPEDVNNGTGQNTGSTGNTSSATPPASITSEGTGAPLNPQPSGPLSLKDDQEVMFGEGGKPFKVSDLRGLQSQFTKVSQARAQFEKDLKSKGEETTRLQNALRVALGESVKAPQADPYAGIKDRPYITGAQLAETLGQSQGQMAPMVQLLQVMAQKIQGLEGQLTTVSKDYSTRSFDQKMTGFLNKLGLDPEDYKEEATIFYVAHEGDSLDEDFPEMYKKHLEKQNEREKRIRTKRIEAARNKPFVPGKGGFGSTNGDGGLTGKETPQELADKMWALMQGTET